MARLLAYTSCTPGHVYPPVGMLIELRERGHEVHVRTQAADVERLAALGFEVAPVDPHIEEIEFDDWRARTQAGAMRRILILYGEFAKLEIPDMQRALDEVRPDAVIMDVQCEGAGYVTVASGLPWAQYCPYPPPLPSRDAPPHGHGLPPARGPLGHLRDSFLRKAAEPVIAPHLRRRNELRAGLGLPPLGAYEEE